MQVRGRIRSNYALQAHRVTSTREGVHVHEIFNMLEFFSVTSRRGLSTSRRQINTSLSRHDVNLYTPLSRRGVSFHVATWICTSLCHVATSSSTSRRHFNMTLSRHDVASNVATWIKSTLCHVAKLPATSRRCLVKLSVTSRRDPARRDVTLF